MAEEITEEMAKTGAAIIRETPHIRDGGIKSNEVLARKVYAAMRKISIAKKED